MCDELMMGVELEMWRVDWICGGTIDGVDLRWD